MVTLALSVGTRFAFAFRMVEIVNHQQSVERRYEAVSIDIDVAHLFGSDIGWILLAVIQKVNHEERIARTHDFVLQGCDINWIRCVVQRNWTGVLSLEFRDHTK